MLCPPMLVAILGYFGAHFGECFSFFENHLIFFHKILYIFSWYYSDDHYMKNSFLMLCPPMLVAILGYFGGLFWCLILYFLRTVQYFFMKFCTDFQKLYGPILWKGFNQGSEIGVCCVRTYVYFYWRKHDFGHMYVDTYAHFFPMIF